MENAPLNPPTDDPDKKSDGKKKKKSAEALGVFALGSAPAQTKPTSENIWEKLTLTKRKGGQTREVVPLSQISSLEPQRQSSEPDEFGETRESGEASQIANQINEPEVESERPLDTLSNSEEHFVERAIVETRQQAELASPAEEENESDKAVTEAVELFRYKIISDNETAEQAFSEIVRDLSVEASEAEEPQSSARPTNEADPRSRSWKPQAKEIPAEDLSSGIGGTNLPPPGAFKAANYAPMPQGATPTTRIEKEVVPYYNNEDLVGAAFLGGLVGYLIGRRRGRIKTERRLASTRKKLEQRIKTVERDISFKEAHIRKMARKQVHEQQRSQRAEQSSRRDQRRLEALEDTQLPGKRGAPERIGHVMVAAGEESRRQAEKPKSAKRNEVEKPQPRVIDKRVETMGRAELLDLSGKVPVENTTLRQVYESHLVGEQGLRRLVSEYTRGGDVQKMLREELVEHEIDFERDPLLRDRKRTTESLPENNRPTLEVLLRKAGVLDNTEVREELATLRVRQARQEQRQQQYQQQQKYRRVLDVSMVTVIAVLIALVIVLLLRGN